MDILEEVRQEKEDSQEEEELSDKNFHDHGGGTIVAVATIAVESTLDRAKRVGKSPSLLDYHEHDRYLCVGNFALLWRSTSHNEI